MTICTEYRVLSLAVDFRTKERRLLMAHKLRPSTEALNAQVYLCDVGSRVSASSMVSSRRGDQRG